MVYASEAGKADMRAACQQQNMWFLRLEAREHGYSHENLVSWFLEMVKISLHSLITWEAVSAITWSKFILSLLGKVMMYYDALLCRVYLQNLNIVPRSIAICQTPIFLFASQVPMDVVLLSSDPHLSTSHIKCLVSMTALQLELIVLCWPSRGRGRLCR